MFCVINLPFIIHVIICSGDILLWDLSKDGKEKCQSLHAPGKGHTRFAFNLCLIGSEKKIMCSTSMDRQVYTNYRSLVQVPVIINPFMFFVFSQCYGYR